MINVRGQRINFIRVSLILTAMNLSIQRRGQKHLMIKHVSNQQGALTRS